MSLPARQLEVMPTTGPLVDAYGRVHTYVRMSVTDRCNYRCTYCLPADGVQWMPKEHLLSFEELLRVARAFVDMGVRRIRLTGGEPTTRRGLEVLVAGLSALKDSGLQEVTMTTNGHRFAMMAPALKEAGLDRINVSLDTVDPVLFRMMTRGGDLHRVLTSIDSACSLGMGPVKINCVVIAGQNDHHAARILRHFEDNLNVVVRFIEYMPFAKLGATRKHVSADELRRRLSEEGICLTPVERDADGGPATLYRRASGQLVGFISPLTEHFCHTCNRLRLQADGHLRTCLSKEAAPSIRDLLRSGMSDRDLEQNIRARVFGKIAGHDVHRDAQALSEGHMTALGG